MRVVINGKEVMIPSHLSEMTLGQRIDFHLQHGDLLDQMQASINEMEEGIEKELEQSQFRIECIFRAVSFFIGFSIESLQECEFLDTIIHIYLNSIALLEEQEKELQDNPQYDFTWNEQEWEIYTPELKQGDRMTFGELIDSKQVLQDMVALGKNRWECLLPLCCIFLRKKDEPYEEGFMYDDSERKKLMLNLPLDIALQVGFFLSNSLNSYTQAFPSSINQELSLAESS